jgi:SHS2 domain-containing protein
MSYRLRDHTADVAVEATGETLGAAVGAIADGMAGAICEEWPETGDRFEVSVDAESPEAAVFEYLD